MEKLTGVDIGISKTTDPADIAWCAALMAGNEPWITLQRGYDESMRLLQDTICEVYMLVQKQQPVGFVVIKMKGSFCGYIQALAIAEPYRSKGIGEAALRYMEQLIFQTYPNAFICASSFNKRAQQLYTRLGYETIGILKDYIIKGHDEILMRKTLAPISAFNS
jgi:ribosomal-protein-alanine N-acetyltransferase